MAEFCLDCWNRLNNTEYKEEDYILSKELDLCEGCGAWKHVIVRCRERSIWDRLFPFPGKRRF